MALSAARGGPPRVLVLRALGLGDLLTGVPALRALRRALPDADLALAAPRILAPLVRLAQVVDRVVDTPGPVTPAWTGPPPALAVDLHGRGPRSHRALQAMRPDRLVGFDCPEVGHRGPRWRAAEHERARWCRLVEEAMGAPGDPDDVRLAAPGLGSPAPGAVVIHPGAAARARQWPPERFAEVARRLAEAGHEVVVTGSGSERPQARGVAAGAGLPDEAVLAGALDLLELAALLAQARLLICGDTGVAHLASAYGVPSMVLFGPVPPAEWGPPLGGPHVAVWKGSSRGDPHGEQVDPALLLITVGEVISRAEALLAETAAPAQCR